MTTQIRIGSALAFLRTKAVFSTIVQSCLIIGLSAAALTAQAQSLTGVQSRKIHGGVSYDLPVDTKQLITGNVTVESRAIGSGHRIVFQFDSTITSTGTLSVVDEANAAVAVPAPVISGASSQEIIVTIPVLPDNKRVSISLSSINGIVGLNAAAALGFRLGDTNNSGSVTAIDVSSVRARSGQATTAATFKYDLNTTGLVSAADVSTVKSRSGLYLVNSPPVVNAGTNQTITLPALATLTGTVNDDGLPNPPNSTTVTWSRFSGPSTVTFGNANAASTTASFAGPGTYVLRLTANDSQLTSSADVTITVNASALPGLFEKPHAWNKDVSAFPVASQSGAIISRLLSYGGFGLGKFQTDFTIAVLYADSSTPRRNITAAPGYYLPDSESPPLSMPIPLNGNAESSNNYTCNRAGEDCHVLVVERTQKKLYELYNATDVNGTSFIALGAFVWDLTKQYTDVLRGDQCTSADAAGLPMAALIPTADEVATGVVPHALRFILPNSSMKQGVFVRPATHAGGPSSPDADAPPYGVRFRLQSNFNEAPYSTGAKAILQALKKYGMILSDGGSVALTFADDRLSTAKWASLGIDYHTFDNIPVTAFDVVDLSPEIVNTFNCIRAP